MKWHLSFIAFIFICIGAFGQVQHYNFDHFTPRDGLSNERILGLKQDPKGFIWIATADGLNRFDGYEFKIFKPERGNLDKLIDNITREIIISDEGKVWISSYNAISVYDPESDKFTNFTHLPKDTSIELMPNETMILDNSHNLWFIDRNQGLICMNTKTYQHKIPKECNPNKINKLNEAVLMLDSKENIWIGTGNNLGLFKRDSIESGSIIWYDKSNSDLKEENIHQLVEDKSGVIWFLEDNEICRIIDYSDQGLVLERKQPVTKYRDIQNLVVGPNNHLWLTLDNNKILDWDAKKGTERIFRVNTSDPNGLSGSPQNLLFDKHENLWIGALYSGVFKFDPFHEKMKLIKHIPNQKEAISSSHITTIFEDKNKVIWIGTQSDGYDQLYPDGSILPFENKELYYKSCLDNTLEMMEDSHGNLWIGTCKLLHVNVDENSNIISFKSFEKEDGNENSLSGWFVNEIIEYNDTTYLLATRSGLNIMTYKNGKANFKRFTHSRQNPNSIASNAVWCALLDGDTLWMGTDFGLSRFNVRTEQFQNYFFNQLDTTSLSYNNVKFIYKDKSENLWIGTEGGGLNLYLPDIDGFRCFQSKDGLIHDKTWGILEDDHGNLWINTDRGISKFNPKTEQFTNFPIRSNVVNNQWGKKGYLRASDGKMYFPVNNGLAIFHPDSILPDERSVPVILTHFNVYNKPVEVGQTINGQVILEKSVSCSDEIKITWKNNAFSLEFAGLNYKNSMDNKYAYTLQGFNPDNEWIITNAGKRYAAYSNLRPGQYTFKVKAANSDGIWDEKNMATLKITILPPFWLTWWFKVLVTVLIVSAISTIFWLRIKSMKKRQIVLEKQVIERTAEIESQKEELRTQSEKLQQNNLLLQEQKDEIEAQSEELRATMEELHHTNLELEKLNLTKDKFFSIIAHDLKNPFHAISGMSSILNKSYEVIEEDKKREFLKMIESSSKSASGLLDNLLTWSRSQTNRIKFNPVLFNLQEIIDETFNLLEVNSTKKNIELLSNVPENESVYADPNMISTVIRNLISNALKFTPENGKVTISSKKEQNHVTISITDTGVGMTEKVLDKLFKIDQQQSTTGTAGESGTGLGLIICKEFVEKNNGIIKVESKINKGSTFIIELLAQQE